MSVDLPVGLKFGSLQSCSDGFPVTDPRSHPALAQRLRELRTQWPPVVVTQRQLADALGVSVPLISSWESTTTPAVPSEGWLQAYARFFATQRSIEGDQPRLLELRELTDEEEQARRALVDELVELREAVARPAAERPQTGALGGRFYYFPDGQPVRIIYSKLSDYELLRRPPSPDALLSAARHVLVAQDGEPAGELRKAADELQHYATVHDALTVLEAAARELDPNSEQARTLQSARATFESVGVQYANPWHPNAIGTLHNGDGDALLELLGHVRAENPGADVRWIAPDELSPDDLTGHVILLGGADTVHGGVRIGALGYLLDRLDLPVESRLPPDGDPEYDSEFVVQLDDEGKPARTGTRRETHAPRFVLDPAGRRLLDNGQPRLEYDVALLGRFANPLNLSATVTICSGVFSRGTYGAVRALTDATLRARNERYLAGHFDLQNFWLLLHVPVFPGPTGALTLTPDLTRPFHRLRSSSSS
jgi:transcriptional regulator with XRE-family HTH domain